MNFIKIADVLTRYKEAGVSQALSPNDEMYNNGRDWYWSVGESALLSVLHGLAASWTDRAMRILDLPCGHGRVARHLRAAFPEAELFVSDLDPEAVDFCGENFDAGKIYSQPELSAVALPADLDVIWVGSLFTHVDQARTDRWLRHMVKHLAPHGVVVATFHGLFAEENQKHVPMINPTSWNIVMKGFQDTGFGYAPYTEHDLGDYGVSLAHPAATMRIASAIEGCRVIAYTERGWANNHDVLTITRNDRLTPF